MASTKSTKKTAAKKPSAPKAPAKKAPAKKASAKKTTAAAPIVTPAAPPAPEVGDLAKSGAVLSHLRAAWPPLSSANREAYRALATDAQRSERGKQTKAENVLAEAVRWAVQIDADLRAHPQIAELYSEARYAYFLERIGSLHHRLSAERSARRAQDAKVGAAASGREVALEARRRLLRRAERYAGKRADLLAEIKAATGTIETDASLATSCVDLAAFARKQLARTDEISKRLSREAGLTEELCAKAEEAGKALTAKAAGAALAGRRAGTDSPLVNREEGGVLLEMEHAMDVFEEAHEDDDAVRKLTPGPSLARAFGIRKPAKKGKAEEEAEEPSTEEDAGEAEEPAEEAEAPAEEEQPA